jgi:TolB-like protein/Flp pilus assembly protein TadD
VKVADSVNTKAESSTTRIKSTPERWRRLKEILADALEQSSLEERTALLRRACTDDATLLREAQQLLEHDDTIFEEFAEFAATRLTENEGDRIAERLGAYVIVQELGRGGMGAVYLAERADGQFHKRAAIKVLKRGTDTEEVLRRFRIERQILAELEHPNITRLLDAGTTADGLPYFVMEFVEGTPITRFVQRENVDLRGRLSLFIKVCSAVELAHRHQVIHRDIKPHNVLVNADREPKLLDFGIAKLLSIDSDEGITTVAGERRLTPLYAAPEQRAGQPATIATDVYSLGALLYELLTNKPPVADSDSKVSKDVASGRVSKVAASSGTEHQLRGDLDAIVLCAMRKEPGMRYATVADLAGDICRHLAGEPVVARHPTLSYRAKCLVKRNGSRLVAGAAVLILLAGVLFAFWARSQQIAREAAGMQPRQASDSGKSIAVLPFESLGDNTTQPYFADGVQDDILTDLGKVRDLKVISRSGVAAYRGKNRNVKQIGRDLGVANVLEGSLQISGDRVRINAQLIDTRTDAQIWAEQYDRKLEDIFALQSELAQTIAGQLKATLSTGEKAEIWRQPTQDLQAYDLYLRARAALRAGSGILPRENWSVAIDLLNRAIARDPKFTLAYCVLSEAYVLQYRYGEDHLAEHLAVAKDAAETALRLEPTREEPRLALARYYYHGLNDYRRTAQELSKIPSSAPHEVEFFTLASLVERRLGQFAASIRDGEKAIELDPQDVWLTTCLSQTYSGLRQFHDSERVTTEAIARRRGAKSTGLLVLKSEAALAMGNAEEAHAGLDSIYDKDDVNYQASRLRLYLIERDYSGAKAFAAKATDDVKKTSNFWFTIAAVAHAEGNVKEEHQAYAEAKRLTLLALVRRPDNPRLLGELAIAEAGLGENEEALRQARRAAEILPTSVDAVEGPMCEMNLAAVLVMTGDRDATFDKLTKLVKLPFGVINYGDLKLDPVWDDLRDDPRFDRILTESASPLATNANISSTHH